MATEPLFMRAYYFEFTPTGDPAVDEILSAVAVAGKMYHHTESWSDTDENGQSLIGNIQDAANRASVAMSDKLNTGAAARQAEIVSWLRREADGGAAHGPAALLRWAADRIEGGAK